MHSKIIVTEDNSKTLLIPELNETYHSTHGALTEARHVFIREGLSKLPRPKEVHILEMGFGTGLNLLVTLEDNLKKDKNIHYNTIEKHPVDIEQVLDLAYIDHFPNPQIQEAYVKAHNANWNKEINLSTNFTFNKQECDFNNSKIEAESIDIIFYDAFGPRVQPDLWEIDTLRIAHSFLKTNGVFVTYCAQGQFKRNLKELGFTVECPPGPPGKREMVRATKK